jgi:signal transduction histidine kinase/ActR/RegA family two-component response regulator
MPANSNGTSKAASGTESPSLLDQLRAANNRLVVSAVRAQGLATQAETSRAEAASANHLKDEAMALVSHELRTPLNAILGWARLLRVGQLDPPSTIAAIETVERNAKALARVVDDLLDMSRVVGGNVHISPYPVDLVLVVRAAVEELHPAAEAKGVTVTFTAPPVPNHVAGDPIRLQQIVANLLSNAIKFTPAGGHVEIALRSADSWAEIHVSDTGRGIAADFIPRIFDQFAQADASTTRQQDGLGLGLAIVRALVEQHGGTVQADSRGLGFGATFIVRFPVLDPGDAEPTAGPTIATNPAHDRLDGTRVVFVENDADGRNALTLLLEVAGAKVMAAASVRSGLHAIETFRPDVIVSDIGLPDEDGYALIARIRPQDDGRGRRIPAIALTGYARPQERARLLAAGFDMHLAKPVDPDILVAAVASLTAIRSLDGH